MNYSANKDALECSMISWKQYRLVGGEFGLLFSLMFSNVTDKSGVCFMGIERLAATLGKSVQAIKKGRQSLVKNGFIVKVGTYYGVSCYIMTEKSRDFLGITEPADLSHIKLAKDFFELGIPENIYRLTKADRADNAPKERASSAPPAPPSMAVKEDSTAYTTANSSELAAAKKFYADIAPFMERFKDNEKRYWSLEEISEFYEMQPFAWCFKDFTILKAYAKNFEKRAYTKQEFMDKMVTILDMKTPRKKTAAPHEEHQPKEFTMYDENGNFTLAKYGYVIDDMDAQMKADYNAFKGIASDNPQPQKGN